jgi:hypothetical protein
LDVYGTRASVETKTSVETIYCKTADAGTANVALAAYGANSRYAASVKCNYPLIPNSPTAFVDITDVTNPVINAVLPSVSEDVWGVEIRASDNSTVLYHDDLTDAGYSPLYTVVNNVTRSLDFYAYTYNLLGEYSSSYHLTYTIPSPSVSGLSVDDATKTVQWTGNNCTSYLIEVDTTSSAFSHLALSSKIARPVSGSTSTATTDTYFPLPDTQFFPQRWIRVTGVDALGSGTPASISHVYTPTAVVSFGSGEAVSIPAPATPATDPVIPTGLAGKFDAEVIKTSWANYRFNQERPY